MSEVRAPATAPSTARTPSVAGGTLRDREPLSAVTVERLQRSWSQLALRADEVAAHFYQRLFELDPSLRALLEGDPAEQKRKLVQTLAMAVDGLSHQSAMRPVLLSLGLRHSGYLVEAHHYDRVGEALLWTVHQMLGADLTPELERAWTEGYAWVAHALKAAAEEALAAPSPRGVDARPLPAGQAASQGGVVSLGALADAMEGRPVSEEEGTLRRACLDRVDPDFGPLLERGREEEEVRPARQCSSIPPRPSQDSTPTRTPWVDAQPAPTLESAAAVAPWSVSLRSDRPLELQVSLAVGLDDSTLRRLSEPLAHVPHPFARVGRGLGWLGLLALSLLSGLLGATLARP